MVNMGFSKEEILKNIQKMEEDKNA